MNISLTPELQELVEHKVTSGLYQSASEVVRAGLRLLQERDAMRQARIEAIRGQIAVGLEQAKRGELLDGEQVFEELEQASRETSREVQ